MNIRKLIQIILVLIGTAFCISACDDPFKTTDPREPQFKVENFRWDDYGRAGNFVQFLKEKFPKGTSRNDIEKILLSDPDASISQVEDVPSRKKNIGSIMGGEMDRQLQKDPNFQSVKTMVKYRNPVKKFSLNPPSRFVMVFYDKKGRMLNMTLGTLIVHPSD